MENEMKWWKKVLISVPSEYCQLFQSRKIWKEVEESPESEDLSEYVLIIITVLIIFNVNTFKLSSWTSKYKFCNEFVVSFLQFPMVHRDATNRVIIDFFLQ